MTPAAHDRPRALEGVLVGVGILAFVVLAAVMWHSARPEGWEKPLIRAADRVPIPFRGAWITVFRPVGFSVLTFGVAGIIALAGRPRLALTGLAGCLGAVVAAEVVFKPLVDRVRTHIGHHHQIVQVGSRMFPSAHVTAAAGLATFVWIALDRRAFLVPVLALVPFAVACSTLTLQLHYPADVIGGALLGSTFVWCTVSFTNRSQPAASIPEPTESGRAYDPVRTAR